MGDRRDLTAPHREGHEFPVEIGLNPIHWQGDRLVIASVVDLSARKEAELNLRQAHTNLEEFTYVASHDLKSPMRAIASLMEFVEEDIAAGDFDGVRVHAHRVRQRVDRAEQIINDLLGGCRANGSARLSASFRRPPPSGSVKNPEVSSFTGRVGHSKIHQRPSPTVCPTDT